MYAKKNSLRSLSAVYAEEMKEWTVNSYQMVNKQISLLAGRIDGTSALDQCHIVIFIAAIVSSIVSLAENPQIILILRCQLFVEYFYWLGCGPTRSSLLCCYLMQGKT